MSDADYLRVQLTLNDSVLRLFKTLNKGTIRIDERVKLPTINDGFCQCNISVAPIGTPLEATPAEPPRCIESTKLTACDLSIIAALADPSDARLKLEELVEELQPKDFSETTIRRSLAKLQEMGAIVSAKRKPYGYRLNW